MACYHKDVTRSLQVQRRLRGLLVQDAAMAAAPVQKLAASARDVKARHMLESGAWWAGGPLIGWCVRCR